MNVFHLPDGPDLTADFTVGSPSGQKAAELQELEIRYRFGEKSVISSTHARDEESIMD